MAQSSKLTDGQIRKARQILAKLPVKDGAKSPKVAAELLEQDFKKARQKGYGHTEISNILKQEEIVIPAYLVKKYLAASAQIAVEPEENPDAQNEVGEMANEAASASENAGQETGENPVLAPVDEPENEMEEQPENTGNDAGRKASKKRQFAIIPDTPDGEL